MWIAFQSSNLVLSNRRLQDAATAQVPIARAEWTDCVLAAGRIGLHWRSTVSLPVALFWPVPADLHSNYKSRVGHRALPKADCHWLSSVSSRYSVWHFLHLNIFACRCKLKGFPSRSLTTR